MSERKEAPRFDFSALTWGDAKIFARAQGMIRRAGESGNEADLEAGFALLQEHLAKCVVYVPKDWYAGGEEPDWSKAETFDRLKANRMGDLLTALAEAQRPENAGGN